MSHFNQIASSWDTPEKMILNEKYSLRIKEHLHAKNPQNVLEIGCGTGLLGSFFLNQTSTLLGLDTSKEMLNIFNEKFKNVSAQSLLIDLEKDELSNFNVPREFDLVISSMAFHHLVNPLNYLLKLKQYLRSGSVVALIDLDKENGDFHPDPKKMGVHHFGFSEETTLMWSKELKAQKYYRETIHIIEKNDNKYPLFLSLFYFD